MTRANQVSQALQVEVPQVSQAKKALLVLQDQRLETKLIQHTSSYSKHSIALYWSLQEGIKAKNK